MFFILEALVKLDPNERCSLILSDYTDQPFLKTSNTALFTSEQYHFLLTESGFFDNYENSLKEN